MPWDLIFYGSMAIIFIGIMVSSARARRDRKAGSADRPVGTTRDSDSFPGGSNSRGS